jgi:hypothetical protein
MDLARDDCARIPAGYSKYNRQAVWIERDIRRRFVPIETKQVIESAAASSSKA